MRRKFRDEIPINSGEGTTNTSPISARFRVDFDAEAGSRLAQDRARRAAAAAAAKEALDVELGEQVKRDAELRAQWDTIDKTTLIEAQSGTERLASDTAKWLKARNLPFNLDYPYVTGNKRWGRLETYRLPMWGSVTRSPIMRAIYTTEGSVQTESGEFQVDGRGLAEDGREFRISGPEATPRTEQMTVTEATGSLLIDMDPDSLRTARLLTDIMPELMGQEFSQAALDEFAQAEYEAAKQRYVNFALGLTRQG